MSVRAKLVSTAACLAAGLIVWPGSGLSQIVDPNANARYLMEQGHGGGLSGAPDNRPSYSAAQLYQMGLTALAAGKVHEAERDFDHAVNADKTNARALTMRGVARERGGNLDGAVRDFEKSLKMDPTQITALQEYGVTLAKQGKPDKAKAQLGLLKLQAEGCGDACPDAAKLKEAVAAVQEALGQPAARS
jgi:Flp pilus assembly protein TadD